MRRLGALAASLVLLPMLSACGGGDDSGPAADPTTLPSDSGSRDGGGPDQSSGGPISQENPKRFIARWAAAEAAMQHTGKATPYLKLSKDCHACFQLARTVADYYHAGGYIRGGTWQITSIKAAQSSNGLLAYDVHARVAPETVRESSSSPAQHVPAREVTYQVQLLAKGSSFTVASRTLAS